MFIVICISVVCSSVGGRDHTIVGFTSTVAISNYHSESRESRESREIERKCVLYTTLCDQVYQWLDISKKISESGIEHLNPTNTV